MVLSVLLALVYTLDSLSLYLTMASFLEVGVEDGYQLAQRLFWAHQGHEMLYFYLQVKLVLLHLKVAF
jgi:hypothetical protein